MGSETYVNGEKLALHAGLEPAATAFREPRSAVELMERRDEIYVGRMPLSKSVVINVLFIMPITITHLGQMSNTFAKNLRLPLEGVDNKGLGLLFPTGV